MQADNNENRRPIDPVLAIKEIKDAGFILIDCSDLHYRPDDELRYEVGRKTMTGNTDKFTLKFKKVKKRQSTYLGAYLYEETRIYS
jgi:predicted methyltransferase